jgi:uncharacterized membrane protein PM0507
MSALKDSAIYLIGEVFSKALPFLLIPYLSRKLGVAGYGELSYYQTYIALSVILFSLAQEGAVTRYFYFYGKNSLDLIVRTGYIYTLTISTFFLLISLYFKSIILSYIILAAVFEIFVTVQLSIRQCQKKAIPYTIIRLFSGIISVVVTVAMLEIFKEHLVEKRILAILISNIFVFIFSYSLYRNEIKTKKFTLKQHKIALLYILNLGIPMIFHHMSFYIKGQVDRIFIYHKFSETDLGLYAMGANLATILMVFIGAVNKATLPYYYEGIKSNKITIEKIHKWFFISLLFPFIISLIISIIPESFLLLILGNQFIGTKYYIIIFTFSMGLAVPYAILVNFLFYHGKNKIIAICSVGSTIVYIIALVALAFTKIKFIPYASILAAISILPFLFFMTKKINVNK